MSDVFNYLSERAKGIVGAGIPPQTLSLVIQYFDGEIDKVAFQTPPQELTETKNANYASENVLGRFEPVRMYTNSDATKINFEVPYYWLEDTFLDTVNGWNGIKKQINKLRACLYPFDSGMTKEVKAEGDTEQYSIEQNAFNKYIGRLSPPPTVRLYFGDIYQGIPCILTSLNVTYKGPWNDHGLAAVARRLAAQFQSRYSDALQKTIGVNVGHQSLDPVSRIADMIPNGFLGAQGFLINSLQTLVRSDKLFPLETRIAISLETNYKFGIQQTYNDISPIKVSADTGLSKNKVAENYNVDTAAKG
ncbi:MAG TPA: hypothetical protein VMV86_03670 [Methanosarcinales archaeon]|nr:hypothetical protein [Methanosarcinales archaeon]